MKIQTTSLTQTSNELLGKKEKILYYLIIENTKGEKVNINIGEKNYESVKKLIENENPKKTLDKENNKN